MRNQFSLLLILVIVISSCVPQRKYNELLQSKTELEKNYRVYKVDNQDEILDLKKRIDYAEMKLNKLRKDSSDIAMAFQNLQAESTDLNKRYNEVLEQSELQLSSASTTNKQLESQLAQKQKQLDEKERSLKLLEADMKKSQQEAQERINLAQAELDKTQKELEVRELKVNELNSIIKSQEEKTNALRNKVNDALLGFTSEDLSVEQKEGKVYVSLSQNLLFASGSTNIDSKGKDALEKLASVLAKNPDINITIEGHTDNVPLSGRGGLKDNWDLSVMRSTAIVRVLTTNGVDPKRIIAAGRGEYIPKADNTTKEGRALNRRSEIILEPKLDELLQIINN